MSDRSRVCVELAVGIDVSDKMSKVAVVDEGGSVIERLEVRNTERAFRASFGSRLPCRIALEAGTHSPWMKRLLEDCGHEVFVANPRKVRLISESDSKNDAGDAELLARLVRFDPRLLSPIEHREEQMQLDLEELRARDVLVQSRTALINHVRGVVKSSGSRLPKCSANCFASKAAPSIPKALRYATLPLLRHIGALTKDIRRYERRIESICEERYPVTALLRQPKGVGAITSLCFVLTIADPRRFSRSRAVGAYLGLRPRQDESGETSRELRITKAGNPLLRRLLVQSARYILGPFGQDCDLRRFGQKIAARGGKRARNVAAIAVARKLAVLMHRLWITGEIYEPLRHGSPQAA